MAVAVLGMLTVALWVQREGSRPNPDLFRPSDEALARTAPERALYRRAVVRHEAAAEVSGPAALLDGGLCGPGWRRDGGVEEFDPERLHEKIDGREGLYKAYAFRRLWTASYAFGPSSEVRVEVEVFLQGSPVDAFGVLSTEREGLTTHGAQLDRAVTPNGLYLVAGPHYVRLVGSEESARVRQAVDHAAGRLSQGLSAADRPERAARVVAGPLSPVAAGDSTRESSTIGRRTSSSRLPDPDAWTPAANPLLTLGAEPASLQYQAENGLGQEYFRGVYLGTFIRGKARVTAWLHAAPSEKAAAELFREHSGYLSGQGKRGPVPGWSSPPGAVVAVKVDMLNTWEWVFHTGRLVGGVTEALDADAAAEVARHLWQGLGSKQ
ncbi:MAG: hypothetical protein HY814_01395 [Candidatus Riflebacteria bacterium]|nr:hypothetical protein [Candidatus Riflebacteria bacterium]